VFIGPPCAPAGFGDTGGINFGPEPSYKHKPKRRGPESIAQLYFKRPYKYSCFLPFPFFSMMYSSIMLASTMGYSKLVIILASTMGYSKLLTGANSRPLRARADRWTGAKS
jgi:hypothetical protein